MKKQHANCVIPFSFLFLLHKLNTLDFNLLIAYAHCTRGFFFSFSFFISFQFFNFFIYWEWVYYGLLFFFSSFISSLVEPKKGKKKAPLLFHSAILPGFDKKGHFLFALMA